MTSLLGLSRRGLAFVPAVGLLVVALMASGAAPVADQKGPPAPLPKVMQVKLDHAQAVLRALVTEDYVALERHATALGALTRQAEWGLLKTPEYARHSQAFLQAAESLAASAKAGDLNGATLDYSALTLRCVQCHRHVRGVRAAD